MALSRTYLKSMGLTEEQVSAIIENHTETVEGLKKERDDYKTKAEGVGAIAKERDELAGRVEALEKASGDVAKVQAEYDAYKKQVETEKANAGKKALVRKALENAGANPAALDLLLNTVDLSKVETDGEAIKDVEAVLKPVKEAHSGLFGEVREAGTPPLNPPTGNGKITREGFEKLPLMKRMEYINAHPEQKKELIG